MTTFWAVVPIGVARGGVRGLLVVLFALPATAGLAIETGPPQPRFALGNVDLITLAASSPPIEVAAPAAPEPERSLTGRELHARVEAFLANEVRAEVAAARWRLAWADGQSAVYSGGNVSDSLSALFVVLLGSISYATNSGVRDAKVCVSFLDRYDARVRALRDDVPESDATAPAGLLERWERLTAELVENAACHRGR